jgi:aromatic-amino-acid transaminase
MLAPIPALAETRVDETLFGRLTEKPADALLSLIGAYRDDPRPHKIDLGVGVYRTAQGLTPVMNAVKAAESRLLETQGTKAYLGPEGDVVFLERLIPLIFGAPGAPAGLIGLQTPGGTGALRLAAELIFESNPDAALLMGVPTWPNHPGVFDHVGVRTRTYAGFDRTTNALAFEPMMEALNGAAPGDIALLHGCCHNPTGADPTPDQWRAIAEAVARRGIVPLVDLAYQGLGGGLEADAQGLRMVVDAAEDAIIAYSLDKNFGLYRERVGAIFVKAPRHEAAVRSSLLHLARAAWSMPPDHGAAVARIVLEDEALERDWRSELESMRLRLRGVRDALAAADDILAPLARQEGLFSLLPLSPAEVGALRRDHAIYMAGSGRINIAGLAVETVPIFAAALRACRTGAST